MSLAGSSAPISKRLCYFLLVLSFLLHIRDITCYSLSLNMEFHRALEHALLHRS